MKDFPDPDPEELLPEEAEAETYPAIAPNLSAPEDPYNYLDP